MSDVPDRIAELRDAAAELRDVRRSVADAGADLDAVVDAYRDVADIMDRYEERATDWDDFEGYVEFREALSDRLAEIPNDLPHHDAFTEADDELTTAPQKVLSESDFRRAREHLEPARELAELRERWRDARDRYRDAWKAVRARRDELRERVDELEQIRAYGEADLDAPVERLRDPIETYNRQVREAFQSFRQDRPAHEVLTFVDETRAYPLVPFESPDDALLEYVADADVGDEPVSTLLSYLDYSQSKLDHYVDDPQAFRAAVAPNQTYLQRLDADPLTVAWPAPPAVRLRWRSRELVAVVGRFADESVVAQARKLRQVAERDEYKRLRESAIAQVELDEAERDRLERGVVESELTDAREELARFEDALDEHPPLDSLGEPSADPEL